MPYKGICSSTTFSAGVHNQLTKSCLQPTSVAEVRTLSTTHLYAYKWKVFESWCSSKEKDPVVCSIPVILSYSQECLDGSCVPSTLKLCIAAISAIHSEVDRQSLGRNGLVIRFLWLNPPRPSIITTWGLALVLKALACSPSLLPSQILLIHQS